MKKKRSRAKRIDAAALVADYAKGFTVKAVAERAGIDRLTAKHHLQDAGVFVPRTAPADECGHAWMYYRGCRCEACSDAARVNRELSRTATEFNENGSGAATAILAAVHSTYCMCHACQTCRIRLETLADIGVDENAKHGTLDNYFMGCDCVACTVAYYNRRDHDQSTRDQR